MLQCRLQLVKLNASTCFIIYRASPSEATQTAILFACPSVTLQYCVKMAKRIIEILSLSGRPATLNCLSRVKHSVASYCLISA